MEIGTKVYLKLDQPLIITYISTYGPQIDLKSPDGKTSIHTTIDNVTTSLPAPINLPTSHLMPIINKGDIIITKPNAKSASGCQIGNMVGMVESISFNGFACTIKWLYDINRHTYDNSLNTIYTSEIAHIHTLEDKSSLGFIYHSSRS